MGQFDIVDKLTEYLEEMYVESRWYVTIQNNSKGTQLLAAEVEVALHRRKTGKAQRCFTSEETKALSDFRIEILTFLNDIYTSGYIPSDLIKSMFIALPKKPCSLEFEDYRRISLMSHMIKLFLRIILKIIRNKIKTRN